MIYTLYAPVAAASMPEALLATRQLAQAATATDGTVLPAGTIYSPLEGGLDESGASYITIEVPDGGSLSEPLP